MRPSKICLGLSLLCLRCSSSASDPIASGEQNQTARSAPARDWSTNPAILEVDDANEIYALSDPHGEYEILSRLLASNHLIDAPSPDPTKVKWAGGSAILVIDGDLIDKGAKSLEVIDLARSIQASAAQGGGRVIVTMGNHEAEFLLDPRNKKAMSTGNDAIGIDNELDAAHIDPESLVRGTDAAGRGAWLASLPFGVRIKEWFFSHAGNTSGLSIGQLEKKLEHSLDHNGFGDKDITGNSSILEAQNWYDSPDSKQAGQQEADALGVKHIVFGHDPGAFGDHGRILSSRNGILVKLDTAMGIASNGVIGKPYLLHVVMRGQDSAEVLDENGAGSSLP